MDDPLVSVIIPFFQRQKGLLERAVRSILSQSDFLNYKIIVIDDGSPVSADDELAALLDASKKIRIIRQENAGPGAARNRGLDSIEGDTKYVAFLDSDDCWRETFLCEAVFALKKGYDLFFGNSRRFGIEDARFEWNSSRESNLYASDHLLLDEQRQLYEYEGDLQDFAVFRSGMISTSAMLYKYAKCPKLRFKANLYNGQDRLFKLNLCIAIEKAAFSPRVYVNEGRGVNIFDSATWGSPQSLVLTSNYIKLYKYVIKEIDLNRDQKTFISSQLYESRNAFIKNLLHLLANRVQIDWSLVLRTFGADVISIFAILPNVASALIGKIATRK